MSLARLGIRAARTTPRDVEPGSEGERQHHHDGDPWIVGIPVRPARGVYGEDHRRTVRSVRATERDCTSFSGVSTLR